MEKTIRRLTRPPTLGLAVSEKIRELILRGELLPGKPLREVQLSSLLGVSRGTLRESVRYLCEEGLVEISPHRGASVIRLSCQKAREIYTLRAMLEPYAVRLSVEAKALELQDLHSLEALLDRWGELEKECKIYDILRAEIEFHQRICQGSGHQLLLRALENLVFQTQLFVLHTKLFRTDLVPDEVSHRAILDAIRTGDPTAAEEAVRQHILAAGAQLMSRLESFDAQSSDPLASRSNLAGTAGEMGVRRGTVIATP